VIKELGLHPHNDSPEGQAIETYEEVQDIVYGRVKPKRGEGLD
jgi:hypothetical protein